MNPATSIVAGEEGFEPSHAGIKIRCLNQLGDSPKLVLPVLPNLCLPDPGVRNPLPERMLVEPAGNESLHCLRQLRLDRACLG